jgi:hypothetical protein
VSPFVGRVDVGRHHGTGVEIDGVFRLVGQMRASVLHPGDLRVGIGPAHPVLVGELLALAQLRYERVNPISAGYIYRLVNQCSGKVVDVSGGSTADHANVQQWGWANVGQQKWKILATSGGYYKLIPQQATTKALEVNDSQIFNYYGGNVEQDAYVGTNNQQWGFYDVGAEYSKVVNRQSGSLLDVDNAGLNDGANIWQWGSNDTCAQRWRLDKL